MAASLMVKCPDCETSFRYQDFREEGCGAACGCQNLEIIVKRKYNSHYSAHACVYYTRTRPIIYELNEETQLTSSL
jgi:hypothetical protein